MPEGETTVGGQIPSFCVLCYYQWEFHACSLAMCFLENLLLNPISNCGFLNCKWKWLGRKKKMNQLSLSNCLKYVFSKYPFFPLFFFSNKDPTKYVCTQEVLFSSEVNEGRNKVIDLKHSFYL